MQHYPVICRVSYNSRFDIPPTFLALIHLFHNRWLDLTITLSSYLYDYIYRSASAIALPATFPVNKQLPTNVPSKERYP